MRKTIVGLMLLATWSLCCLQPALAQQIFRDYPAETTFGGTTTLPDFNGRDRPYRDYRTRIREGLNEGPNFAGSFSVIQIGCGTSCSFAFVADNRTGRVFEFPRGGEENYMMQLAYVVDSRAIAAQWADLNEDACIIEVFEWTGAAAVAVGRDIIGSADACYDDINATLAQ